MKKLTVRGYMTPSPYTIGHDQTLAVAHELMRTHQIRHLPVLRRGRLVGIVSDRDLRLIETLKDVVPEQVKVEEAMTPDPRTIEPDSSLEWVAMEMAEHKLGAMLVVEARKVIGVLTTIDALRALQDLLSRRRRAARKRAAAGVALKKGPPIARNR